MFPRGHCEEDMGVYSDGKDLTDLEGCECLEWAWQTGDAENSGRRKRQNWHHPSCRKGQILEAGLIAREQQQACFLIVSATLTGLPVSSSRPPHLQLAVVQFSQSLRGLIF